MKLQDIHARSLRDSAELSGYQAEYTVSPLDVIPLLNHAGISFVLVGAHGLGGWLKEPRGTKDVDLVVATKHLKKATRVLQQAFPYLQVEEHEVVIRFREPNSQEVVIDVMKPNALYRETFKHTHAVSAGGQSYRIPSLAMALTMKYASMLSPNRQEEDKHQDAHDFIRMVRSNANIDADTLSELGELVYGGGGKGILEMLRKVRAGERLVL